MPQSTTPACAADGLVAIGLRGQAYGVWTRSGDGRWRMAETFGEVRATGGSPAVASIASLPPDGSGQRRLLVSIADGQTYQLWSSPQQGTWDRVLVPLEPEVGSERVLAVANRGKDVLLLADDGMDGRIWLANWSLSPRDWGAPSMASVNLFGDLTAIVPRGPRELARRDAANPQQVPVRRASLASCSAGGARREEAIARPRARSSHGRSPIVDTPRRHPRGSPRCDRTVTGSMSINTP